MAPATTLCIRPHDLRTVDMSCAYPLLNGDTQQLSYLHSDKEHYMLLAALSRAAAASLGSPFAIVDIGSHHCLSAAALCAGASAGPPRDAAAATTLFSFDRPPHLKHLSPAAAAFAEARGVRVMPPDADARAAIGNLVAQHDVRIVALDVEPHDGVYEREVVQALLRHDYKGILVLDDIFANQAMRSLWQWLPLKKIDLTPIAHWSGTGIAVFDPEHMDVAVALPGA